VATDNNIHNYTAADIEKYHKGLLSSKQMHEMEKAALDDPFLSDAMEGYTTPGVNMATDIADLKNRLAEKTQSGKVVAMNTATKKFQWWRVAAAVLLFGGLAALANQFFFNNEKKNDIAQAKETTAAEANKITDSAKNPAPAETTFLNRNAEPSADKKTVEGTTAPATINNEVKPGAVTITTSTNETSAAGAGKADAAKKDEEVKEKSNIAAEKDMQPMVEQPAKVITPLPETKREEVATADKQMKRKNAPARSIEAADDYKKTTQPNAPQGDNNVNRNVGLTNDKQYRQQVSNVFRGRVTDASNSGIPFANVTNTIDQAGTYTDAKGYFTLISADSIMNVQIKSVGFENNSAQLRNNNNQTSQIVLQDDRKNVNEVVINNKRVDEETLARRKKVDTRVLEEPEPADGWDNYNAYAANNIEIPDELKTKQNNAGTVEVSFQVDKNGEPTNIKVEKSLCKKCDQEVIRLIKEGPKWKRAANPKGRTTVTIKF
jgi:TonB family protein